MIQNIIFLVLGGVFGFGIAWFMFRRVSTDSSTKGFDDHNLARRRAKEEGKAKIIEVLEKQGSITNNQVQELLHVSDATATRYLEELEQQRRVEQVGKTGKNTKYQPFNGSHGV